MTAGDDTEKRRQSTIAFSLPRSIQRSWLSHLLLILWAFLLVLSMSLLIVAMVLPTWIEGTEPTDNPSLPYLKREVGLFKQCESFQSLNTDVSGAFAADRCFYSGLEQSNISVWFGAAVIFIVGLLLAAATLVLVIMVSFGHASKLAWAKLFMSFACLLFMLAAVMVPLGFIYLDDACPEGDEQGQCGLSCTDPRSGMDYFTLCGPYKIGASSRLMFASLVLFFSSSFFTSCI